MGSWTDDTSKRIMVMIKTPTGRYKMAGAYKLIPLDGDTMLVTLPNTINGPCGIEFDEIEFIDSYSRYQDRKAGQPELSHLEYKA